MYIHVRRISTFRNTYTLNIHKRLRGKTILKKDSDNARPTSNVYNFKD